MAYRDHWMIYHPDKKTIMAGPFITLQDARAALSRGDMSGEFPKGCYIEFFKGWGNN